MKRTFKLFIATVGFTLLIATCTTKEKGLSTLRTYVDLTGSTLAADQANGELLFSTDNGATFDEFASLQVGKPYKAKVRNRATGKNLASDFYVFDWSASNPKPNDATSDTPEFTLSGDNKISVKVIDKHCPYVASSWVGLWGGDEVGACCGGTDANNIRQDSSNPNKFIMDNFWGDGVDAYIIFSPSTTALDQIVTLPLQVTSEKGTASGTGTYDQCRGTFSINTTYKIGGKTYSWVYNFHKP